MHRRTFIQRGVAIGAAALGTGLLPLRWALAASQFTDSFGRRSSARGWGQPWFSQRRGPAWGIVKKKGFFDLPAPQEGAGRHNPNPVLALDRDVVNVDVKAKLTSSNKNARYGLLGRAVGYGDYYAAYLEGSTIRLSNFGLGREKELKKANFRVIPGAAYWLRLQIDGTGPVELRAKAWKVGSREPRAWTIFGREEADEDPIVRPGASGFLFLHDDITHKRARIKVDNFSLTSSDRPRKSTPEITFAYAGRTIEDNGTLRTQVVAKTDIPADVVFEVGSDANLRDPVVVRPNQVDKRALTSKAFLTGLSPSSTIYWRPVATSKTGRRFKGRIRALETPPRAGETVRFCFGSCSKSFATSEAFDTAAALNPLFFAHLGDLGYPESALSGGAAMSLSTGSFQDRWTRMLAPRSVTELHRKAAWLMIQDDHDYGADNAWQRTVRPFTLPAFDALSGNLGERHFQVDYGDVHAFFIDTRVNADDPAADDGPNHTLLGAGQKDWLKRSMRASRAPLKIVFSSQPLWGAGEGLFTWKRSFAHERKELLDFFRSLQSDGQRVIVCSGNSHAHYINRHQQAGEKDVIEFVSSGMDRREATGSRRLPDDGTIDAQRSIKSVDGFGFVELRTNGPNATVTMRCIDSSSGVDLWPELSVSL